MASVPPDKRPRFENLENRELTEAVLRGSEDDFEWWSEISDILKNHPPTDEQMRWVVRHASEDLDDRPCQLAVYTDHCPEDMLDSVLTRLVKLGKWNSVRYLFRRNVGDIQRRWAIKEAIDCCANEEHVFNLISGQSVDAFRSLIPNLLARGMWSCVGELLQLGVDDTERKLAVEKASKHASSRTFFMSFLPHCADDQLEDVLTNAVEREDWESVSYILYRVVSVSRHQWAIDKAAERCEHFWVCILPHCSQRSMKSLLKHLMERRLWYDVGYLLAKVGVESESMYLEGIDDAFRKASPEELSIILRHSLLSPGQVCRFLSLATQAGKPPIVQEILERRDFRWDIRLRETFVALASHRDVGATGGSEEKEACGSAHGQVCREIIAYVKDSSSRDDHDKPSTERDTRIHEWSQRLENENECHSLSNSTLESFFGTYYHCRKEIRDELQSFSMDKLLLHIVACVPLNVDLQNAAIKIMLREKRWDVVSHACLTHVWEQVRRELFKAAVEKRQWSVVKQWADHTLYDDQRGWALAEAFKEKQWDVFLLLADHGLTKDELMRVHYRLAKYADWDTLLQLLERGGDIRELTELLQATKQGKKNLADELTIASNKRRRRDLALLGRRISSCTDTFEKAIKRLNWRLVLFRVRQVSSGEDFPGVDLSPGVDVQSAVKAAMEDKAWHVMRQLVRLGTGAAQRDSLFPEMVRRRQWGVCRVLLEGGVSVELCLAAVPELMKMNQWVLLARVMEHEVDDAVRQRVMQHAMERREGSMVSCFIGTMHGHLSVKEREDLFERSLSRGVWQAVKPLVEEKDGTGTAHRDIAMQKAIERRQWDVVDHCERHYADINVWKDADGNTNVNKAAIREDWKCVEDLVYRDGDQFCVDSKGYTVLYRAIDAGRWDTVKLLVQFHGDINRPCPKLCRGIGEVTRQMYFTRDSSDRRQLFKHAFGEQISLPPGRGSDHGSTETPLQMLIDRCHADIIDEALFWGRDVRGATWKRKTTLHAVCEAGKRDTMYYLVARGADPLAVTTHCKSALMYSVQNTRCPQRMVAECISLGFSTHQPLITDECYALHKPSIENTATSRPNLRDYLWDSENFSPFQFALVHNLPAIRDMLYESGSCSYRELFRLYTDVSAGRSFCHDVATDLPYLQKVATTPRSLQSSCRLLISHCFNVRGKRHREVEQLPLKRFLKDYVMFSDLTDPDFGKDKLP